LNILWDTRSVSSHMGGIGRASVGWLRGVLRNKPTHWNIRVIATSMCPQELFFSLVPELPERDCVFVDAGMIDPIFEQVQLPSIIKNLRTDVYLNTCFTIPAIKTCKIQLSCVHDLVFLEHPEWVDSKLRRFLELGTDLAMKEADLVLTVSNYSKAKMVEIAQSRSWKKTDRIRVVFPGLDDSCFSADSHRFKRSDSLEMKDKCKQSLLYIGSIERKKGILQLLDGYKIVRERVDDAPLLIIAGGKGGQDFDLNHEITLRGLNDWIQYEGVVSDQRKYELIARAVIFIFPSLYEGFGIPPLEAMALGTPVIASDATALPEVLDSSAKFVPAGDSSALGHAIIQLMTSPSEREKLGQSGRIWAQAFTIEKTAMPLIEAIRDLEKQQ